MQSADFYQQLYLPLFAINGNVIRQWRRSQQRDVYDIQVVETPLDPEQKFIVLFEIIAVIMSCE